VLLHAVKGEFARHLVDPASLEGVMPSNANSDFGYRATSKKSSDFRCLVSSPIFVVVESMSTTTWILISFGSLLVASRVPSNASKWPEWDVIVVEPVNVILVLVGERGITPGGTGTALLAAVVCRLGLASRGEQR